MRKSSLCIGITMKWDIIPEKESLSNGTGELASENKGK